MFGQDSVEQDLVAVLQGHQEGVTGQVVRLLLILGVGDLLLRLDRGGHRGRQYAVEPESVAFFAGIPSAEVDHGTSGDLATAYGDLHDLPLGGGVQKLELSGHRGGEPSGAALACGTGKSKFGD